MKTLLERIEAKIDKTADGCWNWTASKTSAGYGSIWVGGTKTRVAHRVLYELTVGPVADGLELDHLCENRACVNPSHLEPVSHAENMSRGYAFMRRITHCKMGHEYTPENTYIHRKRTGRIGRHCATCAKAYAMKRYHSLDKGE